MARINEVASKLRIAIRIWDRCFAAAIRAIIAVNRRID